MIKRILFLTFVLAGLIGTEAKAQDPSFTQFYANPLYLNPAFAGTARCPRVCLNYRNQWPAIAGTFVTYSASYDQHIRPLSGGIGLLITNDRAGAGTLNTLNASFMYAYQLNVSRGFALKFGAQATYSQRSLDWSKLNFGDEIDPRYGFVHKTGEVAPQLNKGFVDFSAGILGYGERFYFGAAVHHLTQPNQGFIGTSPLPMKFTGHAGAVIPLTRSRFQTPSTISPNILYQRQQAFQQLNLGVYVTRGPIVGGLWYRNRDSFIVLLGIQQNTFRIGYSYDVTLSKLTNATAGSHEVSLSLVIPCKKPGRKFRTIDCPSF
ncbi:MAG: type IX secretion system membrane protein PorP/SprF [Sphingobacteriales bacterium JAD_PAG50586_3]|nr:MAG: type IX secretion system membrane protein PorP/SprF [Sphingobacteriales bacterium JAD_PAG50586_3]